MDHLWRDLRFGLRSLLRSPGFTAAAVLTLTLGIGATSAVYSVVNGVLLQPLPYPTPDRLVLIEGTRSENDLVEEWPISYSDFLDLRDESGGFESLSACSSARSFNLLSDGEAERVTGELVSASYFQTFGVQPAVGRTFSIEEDRAGAAHTVVVVSNAFWKRRFGGDPGLLGQILTLNGREFSVIGIMEPGFRGWTDEADLWVPISLVDMLGGPGSNYLDNRRARWLTLVGRLAPGASLDQARSELDRVNSALAGEFPETNQGHGVQAQRLRDAYSGELEPALLTLLGSVGFVLLIGCVNVANLLLVRGAERRQEYVVRSVLGARRRRLISQVLTESLLVALFGAVLGLLVARWGSSYFLSLSDVQLQSFVDIGLDPSVIGWVVLGTLLVGAGSGLVPALLVSRTHYEALLREGGRGSTLGRHRFQQSLVVAEVALALVLLIGAGVMIQTFKDLQERPLGFRPEGILTARFDVKGERYADDAYRNATFRELLSRVEAVPGVGAVSLVGPGMPTDDWNGLYFIIDGRTDIREDVPVPLPYHAVTPGYFELMGIPTIEGRGFTFDDTSESEHVIVVSRAFAERYWDGRDPLGQRLKQGLRESDEPWLTVVGVVENVHNEGLGGEERPGPDVYLPMLQNPRMTAPTYALVVQADGVSPEALTPPLRAATRQLLPDLPLYDAQALPERLAGQTTSQRFVAVVMTIFAGMALCLAAVGIYGVIAYNVAQRRREIGVRLAVGAQRSTIFGLVMKQAVTLILAGIVLGLTGAFFLLRLLDSFQHGVAAADPIVVVLAAVFLAVAGVVATLLPARSAMAVQPALAISEVGERG